MVVWLVDDNASCNLYHKIMMEQADYDMNLVVEFAAGECIVICLEELKKSGSESLFPNLILIDINMPLMNGWQILDALSNYYESGPRPKILLVSNSRHPKDIERAKEHPLVDAFIEKYVDEDTFKSLKEEAEMSHKI